MVEIYCLLIVKTEEFNNKEYDGPNAYNEILGFETREQAESFLEKYKGLYIYSSKTIRSTVEIVDLKEPLTNCDILLNANRFKTKERAI